MFPTKIENDCPGVLFPIAICRPGKKKQKRHINIKKCCVNGKDRISRKELKQATM